MKKIFASCLLLFALCACAAQPSVESIQTAIAATQIGAAAGTIAAVNTRGAATATITPLAATSTPLHTATPSATPTEVVNIYGYAWNSLQALEQGGLRIEIARLVVMRKDTLSLSEQQYFNENSRFDGRDTIVQIYFKINNNSGHSVQLYANQALVRVNDEQVDLVEFLADSDRSLGGEFLPGVGVGGVVTFGLRRIQVDDVSSMMIKINRPFDAAFNSLGQDFIFDLDLSRHAWVEKPAELTQ